MASIFFRSATLASQCCRSRLCVSNKNNMSCCSGQHDLWELYLKACIHKGNQAFRKDTWPTRSSFTAKESNQDESRRLRGVNASYISSSMLMTSEKPQRLAARVVGVPSNGEDVCIIYVNVYVYKQKAYKRVLQMVDRPWVAKYCRGPLFGEAPTCLCILHMTLQCRNEDIIGAPV